MKRFALSLILFYQQFISPHKGFRCAYRAHTGRASCSVLGYRSIRRLGLWAGIGALRKRLHKCGVAHRRYSQISRALSGQAGYCDIPCDIPCHLSCDVSPCDGTHHGIGDTACNLLSYCDCGGCDWPSKKKNNEDDQWVHIPPKVGESSSSMRH